MPETKAAWLIVYKSGLVIEGNFSESTMARVAERYPQTIFMLVNVPSDLLDEATRLIKDIFVVRKYGEDKYTESWANLDSRMEAFLMTDFNRSR